MDLLILKRLFARRSLKYSFKVIVAYTSKMLEFVQNKSNTGREIKKVLGNNRIY